MISLFKKLMSYEFIIRRNSQQCPSSLNLEAQNRKQPLWIQNKVGPKGKTLFYMRGPWIPYVANREQLPKMPMEIGEIGRRWRGRRPLVTSPDRRPGLADLQRPTSRIKDFKLSNAIVMSYFSNLRFVSVLCLIIGVAAFLGLAPELLFAKPGALCSPDLGLLLRVVKDTFVNHICSTHQVSSPCDLCNEPLNQTVKEWFPHQAKETFDPLGITEEEAARTQRKTALAVSIAMILLGIMLTESVSQHGWLSG